MGIRKVHKLKRGFIVSTLMMAITLTGCGKEGDIAKSSQVLAKVGDKEITATYFDRHMDKLPESVQRLAIEKTGKKAILEGMINREILYDEAIRKDLDKDVEIKRRLEDIKKELITNALIQKEVIDKLKIEDKEVEDYYRNNPDEFRNRKEIRISQIIVPDRKVAGEVIERLRAKTDFTEMVSKYSTDKPSAARKGDVGYFTYKQLPEAVRDGVFRLGAGEISQPYEIGGHYEIYRITDKRVVSYSFEQIKEPLKRQLLEKKSRESLKTMLEKLKKDVKVQINEGLLE